MADELARWGALLGSSTIPCSLSLLLSPISTLVFSQTGGVLSHQSSLTHRFPQFSPRNLCSLVMLIVFALVFTAMDMPSFRFLFLYNWQNQESFLQHLQTLVSGHLSSYKLFVTLCLPTTSVQTLWSCPASGAPWSSTIPPSLGRGRIINNNNNMLLSFHKQLAMSFFSSVVAAIKPLAFFISSFFLPNG